MVKGWKFEEPQSSRLKKIYIRALHLLTKITISSNLKVECAGGSDKFLT
jgi:hypothetical protein